MGISPHSLQSLDPLVVDEHDMRGAERLVVGLIGFHINQHAFRSCLSIDADFGESLDVSGFIKQSVGFVEFHGIVSLPLA